MEQKLMKKVLQIAGMTCTSCEMRIENRLKKIEGVVEVKAIYSSSNVYVTYDANVVGLNEIVDAIEQLDYKVKNGPKSQVAAQTREPKKTSSDKMPVSHLLGVGIIIFALYIIIKNTVGFNFIPQVNQNMGYGILFVVGLITSLHCIAMCGGINLSQCVSYKFDEGDTSKVSKLKPSLMYNMGRVISYTIIGGIVGALGSVISFSGTAKGIVAIISGVFMVIMGLNMLNIFPWLRKLNPRMPRIFGNKIHNNNGKHGPLYVGLLNGLMPCGPLQAMQIYALGTGSFLAGAASMFFFSLGTVPLMFGFGAVSSFLSGKFTHRMMKVSAVLVMILGIIMLNRGLNLSGIGLVNVAYASPTTSGNVAKIEGNVQVVTTKLESGRYTPFIVQKGIPVKWTISAAASDINGCNGTVTIPKYGISKKLVPGDNLIEFTPDEEGNIPYTCWMGMISSNIKVVSDVTKVSSSDIAQANNSSTSTGGIGGAGGCCGATPPQFAGGKIPTDNIQIAKVTGDQQEVTVTVNNNGFTPAAFVVQKGVKTKIKFNTEQLSNCDAVVVFPEYQGQLDLSSQKETPWLTPEQDFTFQCSMNMLHGYIKVVDDINKINLDDIKKEIQNYKPAQSTGGGGCCGG
ncbi:MAG: sulfite exporter TauE/SafE family protein [Clostridiales bacterium]|jgi:sulfite exporter TauE/SafE/copper chaperone CopZ|nr:sulfite exporter TauE/SafE family protein [Eubacteriales bacterium]MDH7567843.1 sulfite exporter TauE/SafE family protein [Clostridiales bacterium]